MEKPNTREKYERAHERYRHGQQRNQSGAPTLQEEVHHQDHQRERDQKRYHDFLDSFGDRARGIQRHDEIQVVGEALLHLRHELLDAGGSIHCVRPRQLVRGNDGARLTIEASSDAVVLGT